MYFFWGNAPIEEMILSIFAIVIMIIFWWAAYSFIIAIFQFIFSRGREENVKKAWNNVRYMIIGIILSIFLLFIIPFILQKLEVKNYEQYTAPNIFKKASTIVKNIFQGINHISWDNWENWWTTPQL